MIDLINKIYLGDCIEIMKNFPSESISFCITDPPYNYEFIGRDWNAEEINRRTERVKNSKTLVKNIPYGSGLAGGVRNQLWYKRNRENILDYEKWCESWGKELFRVTKPGSIILIFNSTRTVAHVQIAMENCGFYARDIIVWRRNSGIPRGLNIEKKLEKMGNTKCKEWHGWHSCLRNEWEAICVLQKPLINNYIETLQKYDLGLFNAKKQDFFQSNIIENISNRQVKSDDNIHCTVKPLELMKKLIDIVVPNDPKHVVLDPFLGSGTTALACKELNRTYLGIEKYKTYYEIAIKRLSI